MNPFMLLAILIGAGFPVMYSRLAPSAGNSKSAGTGSSAQLGPGGAAALEAARQEGAQSGGDQSSGSLLAALLNEGRFEGGFLASFERDLSGIESNFANLADGSAYAQPGGGLTSAGGYGDVAGFAGVSSYAAPEAAATDFAPTTYDATPSLPVDTAPITYSMPIPNTPDFFTSGAAATVVPTPYSPPPSGGQSSAPNTPSFYGAPSNAAPVFAPSPRGGLFTKAT